LKRGGGEVRGGIEPFEKLIILQGAESGTFFTKDPFKY
jgi:hypothetical protein